jgi:hypothetical protein
MKKRMTIMLIVVGLLVGGRWVSTSSGHHDASTWSRWTASGDGQRHEGDYRSGSPN